MSGAPGEAKKRSEVRKRGYTALMRCTPDERDALAGRATLAGLSVSAFMRRQCLGASGPRSIRRPPVGMAELVKIMGELGKCGSNLNQVARALNSGDDKTPEQIAEAIAAVRQAALSISQVMGGREL